MNWISIFIMIIVIVVIYGLLFRLKNNQIIKTIESFENKEIENNLENVKKINQPNASLFFNGNWTSHKSNMIGDNVTNTIRIETENNKDGLLYFKGKKYKFDINSSAIINTEENNNGFRFKINPNPNVADYRLSYDIPKNVPTAEIIPSGSANSDELKSLIFKYAGSDLSNEVKTIIRNNSQTYKSTTPNIDGNLYSVPIVNRIKSYDFRDDAVTPIYEDEDTVLKKLKRVDSIFNFKWWFENVWKPYIKIAYNNTVSFQIIREFNFANEQKSFSPFSKLYEFEIFKDDKILSKINLRRTREELAQNKLLERIYNITTYVYIHTVDKFSCEYVFSKPEIQFSKYDLLPKNGMERYIEHSLSAPNLTSAERNVNSNFKGIYVGKINTYDENNIKSSILKESKLDYLLVLAKNTQYDDRQIMKLLK